MNIWRKKNPEKYRILKMKQREHEKKNKAKSNARKNDYRKKKDKCQLCGSKEKLEFHHIDYLKHLGITVCFICHRKEIHNKSVKDYKTLQIERGTKLK
jgi:5-methylcytosine-specific restriction endonuclease McrA